MATYTKQTRVDAPFDEVWMFHSKVSGLEALTPEWMRLRVESIRGPEGEPDPEILEVGSTIRLSMRPLGIGPAQRWTSRIVERRRDEHTGMFRDVMEGGPFRKWEHTHRFYADGDGTVVADRVEYELPGGGLGRALSPLSTVGFEPMFRYRHEQTRELLE